MSDVDIDEDRDEVGGEVTLEVSRAALEVDVPRGSAVRLELDRSAAKVNGLDDVDVTCERGAVKLKDVAGVLAVHAERGAIKLALSHDRPTQKLDVDAMRSACTITVPEHRGGSYEIHEVCSSVSVPAAVVGGIPVTIEANLASVKVRSA